MALLGLFALMGTAQAYNPFGVMLWPTAGEDLSLLLARARGLGIAWYRPPAVFIDHWTGDCPTCATYARSQLNIALTVRNDGDNRRPAEPPTNMADYARVLGSILDTWKPALLVVEHEEDNPVFFDDATPGFAGYAAELDTACAMAHQRKLACTNGGLSAGAAILATWNGFLQQNQPDQACDFARRMMPNQAERLCDIRNQGELTADLRRRLERILSLLKIYRMYPLDMVNFHWMSDDARALSQVVNYLSKATGKSAGSNEIVQERSDPDSSKVRPLLRSAFSAGMPVAIWFSVDTPTTLSLFENDGRLRESGWEFQHQMSGRR